MAITCYVTRGVQINSDNKSQYETVTANEQFSYSADVSFGAIVSTSVAINKVDIKALYVSVDKVSGGAAFGDELTFSNVGQTFTISQGEPLLWTANGQITNPLSSNILNSVVKNKSADTDCRVEIRILY